MASYSLTKPPRALSRPKTRLDNIALVPASLLPYKEYWQSLANDMPPGSILVCVPASDRNPRQPYLAVARTLREKGYTVRAVKAESLVPAI